MKRNKGRLLFVITDLDYGGAEKQLVLLATRFVQRGWRVKVVSILPPRAFVKDLERAKISVDTLGVTRLRQFPLAWWRLRKIIKAWRPQIIHSFMVHANILSRLVRLSSGQFTLICSVRNTDEGGKFREWLYRLTDPFCDLTTQVSKAGMERYLAIKAVTPGKIRYIPNGIDLAPYRQDREKRDRLRVHFGIDTTTFLWLAVGRLVIAKDYSTLLKSFHIIARHFTNARLWIVGEGPLRRDLENMVQCLGLQGRVQFLGLRRDIPQLMTVADAFVLSSAWEGMPNVLLEAAASGLPIVATKVGGTVEIVVDKETGYLVPPGDVNALALAMEQIMRLSPEARKKMGENGRRFVSAHFDIEQVVDRWEAVYKEYLEMDRKEDG